MRVGVLGNCQAQGVADSIKSFAPDVDITRHLLVGLHPADRTTTDRVVEDLLSCDVVFLQTLEDRRPEFRSLIMGLVDAHPRAVRIPVFAFRGFHPDCGHVQRGGQQVQGALGPYHSILGCAGWLEGLPAERTAALFNAFSYAALGYFDVYDQARERLTGQAVALGYELSPLFAACAPPFMHTVNHPTASALHEVARRALEMAGVARSAKAPLPTDHLAGGPIWPIYPDIARRIGLPNAEIDSGTLTFAHALVEAEYRALQNDLETCGPLDFEGSRQPNGSQIRRARAFIRDFVVAPGRAA